MTKYFVIVIGLIFMIIFIICILERIVLHDEYMDKKRMDSIIEKTNMEIAVKEKEIYNIDKDSYEIYIKELEKMIEYHTIFKVDEEVGNQYRNNKSISINFENDEVLKIIGSVGEVIISEMSETMKIFLYNHLGKRWIHDYIRMKSTSITLEYVKRKILEMSM